MSNTEINVGQDAEEGYVYVLGVKDIDLPVCKIGRTARDPAIRCAEINKSSTGDFLWAVEHQIAVSDCHKLESRIHAELLSIRQRGREFFNIRPDAAIAEIRSTLKLVPEVRVIAIAESLNNAVGATRRKARAQAQSSRPARDVIYAHLLDSFNELLNVKGRPFGQLNKPSFGISDGREGVQWNLSVFPNEDRARVGVNLEGLKYRGWPIATLIKAELEAPQLLGLVPQLSDPQNISLRFARDAWQAASRLDIVEDCFGGREILLSELTADLWKTMLVEALGCLDKERGYLGRAHQSVTLRSARPEADSRMVPVSPHLTIWTPIDPSRDSIEDLPSAIGRLKPIHQWASKVSGDG